MKGHAVDEHGPGVGRVQVTFVPGGRLKLPKALVMQGMQASLTRQKLTCFV